MASDLFLCPTAPGLAPGVGWDAPSHLAPLIAALQEGVMVLDNQAVIVAANPLAETILGRSPEQMRGRTSMDPARRTIHPDGTDWPEDDHPAVRCLTTGRPQRDAIMGVHTTGQVRWLRINAEPVFARQPDHDDGVPTGVVCTFTEVTDQASRAAEAPPRIRDAIRQADERFRIAFDMAPTGNAILLPSGRFVRVNERLGTMLGVPPSNLLGRGWEEVVTSADQGRLAQLQADLAVAQGPLAAEIELVHGDGHAIRAVISASVVRDVLDRPATVIVQFEDVTARRQAELTLTHQATHDPLTSLPNRALLTARLQQALDRAVHEGHQVALLFCDVDHFKRINDSLGHDAGDQLLIDVGERLRKTIRATDTVARIGGDEFLIVCDDLPEGTQATELAERVRAIGDEPFRVQQMPLSVSLSVGLAFAHPDDDPSTLINRADSAMYEAKAQGRGRYEVYDDTLRTRALHRLRIEAELRDAIGTTQLQLWSQPVVDLQTWSQVGRESLIRWHHPERGLLTPDAFLDVAEESDLIVTLGTWVLEEACRQGIAVHRAGNIHNVAVNVSARQVQHANFRDVVERVLTDSGLGADRLVLELTETALLHANDATLNHMRALSAAGVTIAIDDFGTGYSSLTYLQTLPVKTVKIDRSFLADIVTDRRQRALTQAVIDLGRALDLDVVAEGIETVEQADMLAEMGCPFAQGYFFGRPLLMDPVT